MHIQGLKVSKNIDIVSKLASGVSNESNSLNL